MGEDVKVTIKDKISEATDKFVEFVGAHPVLWYGGCYVFGYMLGTAYAFGRRSGAKQTAKGMLVITRAAADDETYGRIIKASTMKLK